VIGSKGVGHSVCVSYFVTRELLCNYLPVLVECENLTRVGRGFFSLVGQKVFHVKIPVFIISALFIFLLVKNNQ